ncbi:hypothetical protein [Cupriavidus sp. CuC1]|uniref:hypothetical protein n=1 Tax=Cupriavidus sp. CuC1 TaxID=3373131 RepID=UPI0037CFF588
MKNDDILTGIALVGLAFAAYQFMRPTAARAASAPANTALRPLTGVQSKLPAWASLITNAADLGNTLYGGSAAARGMVQGVFAPGDSALQVANFDYGNGPMEQAMAPGITNGEMGSLNGAYTFGTTVDMPLSYY